LGCTPTGPQSSYCPLR